MRGEIRLTLDRDRLWTLPWKAARELERALAQVRGREVSYMAHIARIAEWDADDWGLLLWVGLHQEDPDLTYEQVCEIADHWAMTDFMVRFGELASERVPEKYRKNLAAAAATAEGSAPSSNSSPLPS